MKTHPFHIHVPREPVDLWDKLRRLASKERRTLKQEALLALENHLKQSGMLTESESKKLRA